MWFTAVPSSSNVTCWAEQGTLSPDDVLKTRQSGRKSIMLLLQFFDFLHKIGRFLETPIKTRITHVSDGIEGAQSVHDPLADGRVGDFTIIAVGQVIGDRVDHLGNRLLADWPLLASLLHARQNLIARKLLTPIVALEDHQPATLDLFISGVTVFAP